MTAQHTRVTIAPGTGRITIAPAQALSSTPVSRADQDPRLLVELKTGPRVLLGRTDRRPDAREMNPIRRS